jgi:hypothetical protein
MKKSYISPTIVAVKLQHSGIICTSPVSIQGLSTNLGDDAIGYGGAGSVDARTKESSSIWDEEW